MKKLITLIFLVPLLVLAQPPPITTFPVTVNTSNVLFPTDSMTAAVRYANIQNIAALSVLGRSANTSGVGADITGVDGQVLRVSGTTLGFGTITLAGFPTGAAHTILGNFTGSTAAPTYNAVGTGVDTFLVTPTSANLAAAITNETGTAGAAVFSNAPTFTGLTLFNGNVQIGAGSTSPQPLLAILGSPITFTGKLGADNSYGQFAFRDSTDAQRCFFGYIGPTFSNAIRQDHFEIGTGTATTAGIAFRPRDSDGTQILIDTNGNLSFKNTAAGVGAQGVIVFNNSGVPSTTVGSTGQLYDDAGTLKWRGSSGTVTSIAPP